MNPGLRARALIVGVFAFSMSSLFAQSLPPGVTPEMVGQLRSMTPTQQKALAKQYGIRLPVGEAPSADASELATPGKALVSPMEESQQEALEEIDEVEKRARIRFGRNFFTRDVSTFAPTDDGPVPESYRLGVGDKLVVQLFGKENDQLNLQIGRSGDINFPKLGSITLSGLSFEDARDVIKTRVEQQFIGVDVVVSMGRLRAINIFMAGEVAVPGAYSVSALTTVTQALFQAGGFTDIGSLRNIQVRRAGSVVATFDTYDLLMRGDVSDDIRLQSGDVVFVPPYTGVIELQGELKRPMVYELVGEETIEEVLAMAGAFTTDAYPALSTLIRKSDTLGLQQASTINLSDKNQLSLPVRDGDSLVVPKAGTLVADSISLKGAVTRPGNYGWVSGMRVSDLVGNARRDLDGDADLALGMIVRQKNFVLDVEVIAFDVASAIASPQSHTDPLLEEFDEVLIFSKSTLNLNDASRQALLSPVIEKLLSQARPGEPVQTVSVSGAVSAPGIYPLFVGGNVEMLIKAAGGLNESAFLHAAELRRLTEQSDGSVIADYRDIDVANGSSGQEIELSSRDHLTIREIPGWSPVDAVMVGGEVKFPGEYRIRRGERLADVVLRAGGFTENASPESALFTRQSVATLEAERAAEFANELQTTFATKLLTEETTSQGMAEISQIVSSLESIEGAGRLLIDLPAAMSGNVNANLKLENGDRIMIPVLSNTVSVIGEVKRQGTHSFQPDLTLVDYIELSAGLTRRADEGEIYIVKANGSVVTLERNLWRFSGVNRALYPGDTIVVPINTQYKESLAGWRDITQIIYQSIVTVAALANL